MNSYPPELLAQLAPVMFVAGLDVPPPQATPQSPTTPKHQDPFVVLAIRLREALMAQRKVAIWQPDKNKTFQVVLVDPEVRFPPRKLPPADDQQFHPLHSPLSPLTPSSPLYPDGLIAPIWIRKHTTLVPSVFVLFKRIHEHVFSSASARSPLDAQDVERDREREVEERKRDTELASEIAFRKKSTNERNIKLTVVLMASRKMLDDPALDARLTYIRRQSGLDPRAALFVLSPVTQSEIGDFVRSLQEALYEPAIEYYTNHSKRVRRKRNRHSQANISYPMSPMAGAAVPRPLRPEGWTVRYEYKMACFAEFRGEDEVALKHYQDAYSALHVMFGSTAILPPRTKRWAEAKVLADTISVKICKLYLYNNEHALALAHHTSHMRKFSDLSRGWGIGEETFEFWSWLARQHRVFAELLEQGTRSTLKIPSHIPASTSTSVSSNLALQPTETHRGTGEPLELESARALGLNPTQALQHPGFYYYMAARCTESRRDRFLKALEVEHTNVAVASSPGFANEKKVDHLTIILELYTRSYELFKKYSPPNNQNQGRLTLWIAYRIAQTYYESGKFDMAVRFFERIARTYRREKWDAMLRPLLSTWYACAQQLGDMELSVQLLLEMIGQGALVDQEDPDAIQEDLMAVLKTSMPMSTDQALVVDLTESGPLLDSSVIFWKPEVNVGEAAAYQICLTAPSTLSVSSLPFSEISIQFSGDLPLVTIRHSSSPSSSSSLEEDELPMVQRIDLGNMTSPTTATTTENEDQEKTVEANLRLRPGASIVFSGTLTSDIPTIMTISKMVLTLKQGSWRIELPLLPNGIRLGVKPIPRWLSSVEPVRFTSVQRDDYSSVMVHHRPHRVFVNLSQETSAYLGEEFPIAIDVTNGDDRELEIAVDVLLQPTEIEEAVNYISFDGQRSTSLIKGVSFGVLAPGVNVMKTLYLGTSGAIGDRIIDISIQSCTTTSPAPPASPGSPRTPIATADTGETLRTLVVPTVEPIKVESSVRYKRSTKRQSGIADLATFEADYWDDGDGGEAHVVTTFGCVGQSGLSVEGMKLVRDDGSYAKIIDCLVDCEDDFLDDWLPGDEFCDRCRITLAPDDDYSHEDSIPGPGVYEVAWRRLLPSGEKGSLSISRFPLPPLKPPIDELIALLDVPNTARLHVPITMTLTVRNRHPTRSANVFVQLELDQGDHFVVAGLRQGRLPILLSGSEESLVWNIIPMECGFVKVPKIKVMDRRSSVNTQMPLTSDQDSSEGEDGQQVEVVDVRWDQRLDESAAAARDEVGEPLVSQDTSRASLDKRPRRTEPVVLVLP